MLNNRIFDVKSQVVGTNLPSVLQYIDITKRVHFLTLLIYIIFCSFFNFFFTLGFLRRNRRKDKKKKSSGKEEDGAESVKDIGSDGEDVRKSETPTPEVDDEG